MTTTAFILKLRNYQQTPKEIMTNKFKNKNGNHINTGTTFNFIHYMANLLAWGWEKWVTFAPFFT